jgi:hydrogenase expression/formation protein HypC
MCIGVPMQVRELSPGHAWCEGRGERRLVNTALVGEVQPGDWLLVFIDGARECIEAERAAEVNATLDLIEAAMQGVGGFGAPADAAFVLPSAMSAQEVAALAGQAAPAPRTSDTQGAHLGEAPITGEPT